VRRLAALTSVIVLVLVLLAVAQLVLPGIAANDIRARLERSGQVRSVSVSAFPAIELLWHQADSVQVKLASYRSGTADLSRLLDQVRDVGSLTASAEVLSDGLLTLHDATLRKRGSVLTGAALVREADLRHAVPILQSVTPLASSSGQLVLQGTTASFLGLAARVDVVVEASGGRLIASPEVPLLGSALTLALFADPHLAVTGVAARPASGGFTVSATGTLR
jgi:hypothetical protein